jgi:glyoxylase-like metal-dependent hydrolase (beta-lactamase superfamily II)
VDDVDVVVLTHLHQDHVGRLASPGGTGPAFARADTSSVARSGRSCRSAGCPSTSGRR